MITTRTRQNEIYIRLSPALHTLREEFRQSTTSSVGEMTSSYDAYIYTHMSIPGLGQTGSSNLPNTIDPLTSMPLRAIEHVVVRWNRYQEYLASFFDGTKDPMKMRAKLFETLSPGLELFFEGYPLGDSGIRVWWSCESPELEDLPWELLIYSKRGGASDLSFVRGQPPSTSVPKVPFSGELRLAFIHTPGLAPTWLTNGLGQLPPAIQVIPMTSDPREALEQAAREGFELVHLVVDGIVTAAYEGVLYFHGNPSPELPASELSTLLKGSRVSVLGLTEADTSNPDVIQIGPYEVPSAFRAFAYLGRSPLPLPNLVIPLGPHLPHQLEWFWHNFYANIGESLKVEQAMASARAAIPKPETTAMALFLHQDLQHTFHRLEPTESTPLVDPLQANADLQQSLNMVSQLNLLKEKYGDLPESVQKFVRTESIRQAKLQADLEPWVNPGEEAA
jgi:hypothetical protein